jgi:hypothetical protein
MFKLVIFILERIHSLPFSYLIVGVRRVAWNCLVVRFLQPCAEFDSSAVSFCNYDANNWDSSMKSRYWAFQIRWDPVGKYHDFSTIRFHIDGFALRSNN